jgi:GNAT superfamily N-acetyltransferase
MSIELRVAKTDEELEAWRSVRIAVVPNERCASLADLRGMEASDRFLVAFVDGELAGSGVAGQSDMGGGFAVPRVVPALRRKGVGTALLYALAEHVSSSGHDKVGSLVEDPGSLAFAKRFGFREEGRQVEQVRLLLRDAEPSPEVPEGVRLVSLAERPELGRRVYTELALQAFEDMPTPRSIRITLEQWEREWINWPEGTLVALAGDEIVGCAGLMRDEDRADRAENSLTAVRRDWRGRGLARALKETVIAWGSANGLREIYTWTQTGNEGMRAVNEKLGYVTRDVSIGLRAPLPLPR